MLAEVVTEQYDLICSEQVDVADKIDQCESLVVNSHDTYGMMYNLYCDARKMKNEIDAERKRQTEPLRRRTTHINNQAKKMIEPLDYIIELATEKANGYREYLQQKHAELIEAASIFSSEDIYLPDLESSVFEGTTSTKTCKRFEVQDLSQVPAKYLKIDEEAVERDLKLGIGEIAGLRIYDETKISLRVR